MLKYILCIIGIGCFGTLSAHEINGTITSEKGVPLEGVGVYNKTTGAYTYSNISGYFELDDISEGDILFFHSLGYEEPGIELLSRISAGQFDKYCD